MKSLTYTTSGVNYDTLDPVKRLALRSARATGKHLLNSGAQEVEASRGESAYVWKQGGVYLASVIEGLGTKNLVADAMYALTGKNYYDAAAYDTVASIINDLVSVGARPLSLHAYWAVGNSDWFKDTKRASDLVRGWKKACDDARVSWGGGETPSYKDIINPETIDLAGSAVGIIKNKKQLLLGSKVTAGDRIVLIKSNGINANGLTLARAVADRLPKGYATKLPSGISYGEAILKRSHIYAQLIQDLFKAGVELHYISNITGHGLRKIMRANEPFSYVLEHIFKPQEVFAFIQEQAQLSDYEMYQTFNMGQDYALFIPAKDVSRAQRIIKKNIFHSLNAGYIEKGERQVIIKEKNIVYTSETMNLR